MSSYLGFLSEEILVATLKLKGRKIEIKKYNNTVLLWVISSTPEAEDTRTTEILNKK